MNSFRTMWRCLQLAGLFVYASAELLLKRPSTREARAEWLHCFCARAIKRLNVEVSVTGNFPDAGALISNHLSYLDIVVYAALHRCTFVAKSEIEQWPVVGWMTTMAGTVYVERGRGGSAKRARETTEQVLRERNPLLFFPEGTTSSGNGVLPFHSGLLGQVTAGGQPVTAAFIRYSLRSVSEGVSVRNDVHFWGEIPMLPHILRLLGLRGIRAEVIFGDRPIRFTVDLSARKQVALEARQVICALGGVNPEAAAE